MIPQDFYSEDSAQLFFSGSEEDNLTLNYSCADINWPDSQDPITNASLAVPIRVIQTLYGVCLVSFGVLLNLLVLILVAKCKKLRSISFGIAVQLSVLNLLTSISYGSSSIANYVVGHWILGSNSCIASGFILFVLINIRTLLIFAFSLNQFLFVFLPFFYPRHNGKAVIVTSMLAWFLGIIYNVINLPPFLDCFVFNEDSLLCVISVQCSSNCLIAYCTFYPTIIIPAIFIPVGLFLALYIKGRKIRSRDHAIGVDAKVLTEQEWRAIKTFAILFASAFLVTILPFILFFVSQFFDSAVARVLLKLLGVDVLFLLVITDPLVILRNGDIKEALKTKYIRHIF